MNESVDEFEALNFGDLGPELTPQLLQAWRARVRRWCSRELSAEFSSRVDTSDVVQESMVQVWQDWERFRGQSVGEIKSWMFRIAKGHLHKARRFHRAAKRNVQTESPSPVEARGGQPFDPGEKAAGNEQRLQLMIAIEQLPDDLREVVQLRSFAQQNYREIGERLGIPKSEARNRFLRAIRRLKTSLDPADNSAVDP